MLLVLLLTCATALQVHAATYYVVVAGLGGEPDYEQRFTAAAKDLHRIFTAAEPGAHVYMLTGEQATGAHLLETRRDRRDVRPCRSTAAADR